MNIHVCSLDQAIDFRCPDPWIGISVVSEGDWPNLSSDNRLGLLQLAFWDIDAKIGLRRPMSDDQAEQVLKFVDDYWGEAASLLIHCEAGLSRSPAIAAAISRIKIGHDNGYFRTHVPNRHVYSTLLRVNETRVRSSENG